MKPTGGGDQPGLRVDDLCFEVRRSARRKTLQITVDRGGELILSAPPHVEDGALRQFVQEKRFWIYTKLAEKERLHKLVATKRFVDGEGFLYLGRSYRLKVVPDQDRPLKLTNGRFVLRRNRLSDGRSVFVSWYCDRAKAWLGAKVRQYAHGMQVSSSGLMVQDLGYRWGSCGKGNRLYFHWKTILLPPRIAEYVVVHELAHLHQRHHTPEFWQRVERVMGDFEQRKAWLAQHGMAVEGI